jgi:hypothetical protein
MIGPNPYTIPGDLKRLVAVQTGEDIDLNVSIDSLGPSAWHRPLVALSTS